MSYTIASIVFLLLGSYCFYRRWVLRGTLFFMGVVVSSGLLVASRIAEHWS